MQSREILIINKLGLHARAAARLVQSASQFDCEINLTFNGKTVNGKSIMGIMMLAASRGSTITVTATGSDEAQAVDELETLINNRFGEEE